MRLIVPMKRGDSALTTLNLFLIEVPEPEGLVGVKVIIESYCLFLVIGSEDFTSRDQTPLFHILVIRSVRRESAFNLNQERIRLSVHRIGCRDGKGDRFSDVMFYDGLEELLSENPKRVSLMDRVVCGLGGGKHL